MIFGERIKQIRKAKGLSQVEFAKHCGTDPRQVSRYENGHVLPSLDVLIKMATAMDVTIDYLLIEDAPKRPLKVKSSPLLDRAYDLQALTEDDQHTLLKVLDAFVAKNHVKLLASKLP